MRGEVLHYDQEQGFGFITGADGKRYTFAREDLRREMALARGDAVEFQPNGDRASGILSVSARTAGAAESAAAAAAAAGPLPGSAPVSTAHFGRDAESGAAESTDLWSYFWRGLTTNYVNFSGRARRKEFWGFCLFWMIGLVVVIGAGLSVDLSRGDVEGGGDVPVVMLGLIVLFFLLTFLPWVALIVRRLHDLGLTGWLAILCFLPYVGGLAALVFGLIPTQAGDNKWGPVPAGVRI
ncbi:DUF805 domain-containing protein [Mesorhizobium sp.]|uniref:DUF805 domain-containing protein n=1 Tax=Mesorhizobium sp. TaxID=1871066 RepID=UPI000FE3F46D|nr:DUF805 domain-containing protein [Mesorhizobium sp.]RWA58050.1 MAG: DUF805 domain-containing protein [Mesorhizobium sp.]RWB92788.1 MAG: DUF805 domain-containing protein [Mesorhizobium sp.]RWG75987.1 MAG: DUF805 domain-containing protein [Mesorhizobium sp.]RWG76670.1 MAG: DUF805 domain-containing protein [Mesorhizobium sp.]RWJ94073.1 MAG: DUF805 domain-containing protein [Mesorhizobium sp.]